MSNFKFANPNLAPIFSHAPEAVEETFKAWRGRPESEILDEHARLSAEMDKIHEDLGPNYDLMKTDKLGSDNAASRAEQLTKKQGELIGLENAFREIDAHKEAQKEREENGYVTGARNAKEVEEKPAMNGTLTAEQFIDKVFNSVPAGKDIAAVTEFGQLTTKFKTEDVMNFTNLTLSDYEDEVLRDGTVDYIPQRPLMLWNTIPKRINTNSSGFKFMRQTVHTVPADLKTAEGAASKAVTYTFQEQSRDLIKIAAHFKVTEELVRNSMEMEGISNTLLGDDLLRFAEDQVAGGAAAAATDVYGILNESGVQSQKNVVKAAGIDSDSIDAINDAKWKCFFGARSMPNVVYIHPNWKNALENIILPGVGYILGSPTAGVAPSIRQMTPVVTDAAGFAYGAATNVNGAVVDTSKLMIVVSPSLDYTVGFDADDLTKGMRTVRALLYLNVRNRRPQSVVKLTEARS